MTNWIPQDNWAQPKIGDTVRVMNSTGMLTGEVIDQYTSQGGDDVRAIVLLANNLNDSVTVNRGDWQLSVPEKPAVELPTERGSIIAWWEDFGGSWEEANFAHKTLLAGWMHDHKMLSDEELVTRMSGAPFTKLEPVAVTAKLVIDQFRLGKSITTVAEIFGVSDD